MDYSWLSQPLNAANKRKSGIIPQNTQEKNQKDKQALLDEAIQLHQKGTGGDKDAVKKAYDLLKRLHEQEPENSLVEAYLGSAISLLGRDAISPNERFKLAIKGVKMLDKAIAKDPENIDIRSLRAYVSFRLPEMYFHRTEKAIEDFEYLISRYEQDQDIFSQEYYQQLLRDLETAYENMGRKQQAQLIRKKLSPMMENEIQPDKKTQIVSEVSEQPKSSVPHSSKKKDITKGIQLHGQAFTGDKDNIKAAYEYFEGLYQEDPNDPVVAAYYADCMSFMGRDAMDPSSMFGSAIKAIKLFDSIVNHHPDNIQVRLLRASHSYRLPESFFKRTATAITDFEYMIERHEQDPAVLSESMYWKLLYLLGKAYMRLDMEDEGRAAWQKLLEVSRDDKYRKMVEEEMDDSLIKEAESKIASTTEKEELIKEGIRLHDAAVAGDAKAAKKAAQLFGDLYEQYPDDPMIEGYYGSSTALTGKYSIDSQMMFGNGIKGLQLLKSAVSADPNNVQLKLLRAYLLYNLPDAFFHLTEKASRDFKFLVSAYENDNTVFSQEQYWQILYDLGVCYERMFNTVKAQKVWNKLLEVSSDTKYKELLKSKLERSHVI